MERIYPSLFLKMQKLVYICRNLENQAMKRLYLIATILLCSIALHAQSAKGNHEIAVGVGYMSGLDIIYKIGYDQENKNISRTYKPVYTFSYKYYISDNTSLGIGLSQHSFHHSRYDVYNNQSRSFSYDAVSAYLEIKGAYPGATREFIQLYFSGALGLIKFINDNEKEYVPSSYVSPLGLRIGGANAVFVELGLGYKGLVHGGYSLRLGKKRRHHYRH
jgi:hypothetical protein